MFFSVRILTLINAGTNAERARLLNTVEPIDHDGMLALRERCLDLGQQEIEAPYADDAAIIACENIWGASGIPEVTVSVRSDVDPYGHVLNLCSQSMATA